MAKREHNRAEVPPNCSHRACSVSITASRSTGSRAVDCMLTVEDECVYLEAKVGPLAHVSRLNRPPTSRSGKLPRSSGSTYPTGWG